MATGNGGIVRVIRPMPGSCIRGDTVLDLGWRFLVAAALLLLASRLCLCIWQHERVRAAGGLWPILLGGLRIDASFLAMVAGFPLLFAPWIGMHGWAQAITQYWFGAWWLVLVLLEVATPQFIVEYDSRPNRLFVAYLTSPREVGSMLWQGYKPVLAGGLLLWAVLGWLGMSWIVRPAPVPELDLWARAALTAGLFVVLFLAGRGTLGHRPLNAAHVAFSSDAMVNMLPLNSAFVVANAVRDMRDDKPASAVYGRMDEARMREVVRAASGNDTMLPDPERPILHRQVATATHERPRNIVVIVEESLGAQFTGCLGGKGYTPELDALADQGWLLARNYATGTRSVRGLEAIVSGFLPTPADAVFKLPRSQRDFFSLGDLLGRFGYHSRFVYGGEAHFDNMKGFFLGNGFDEVIDRPKFGEKPKFVGSWGASDEDMFDEVHRRLSGDGDEPTLTVAFSVTNHSPWEYPAGRIEPRGEAASVENTVRYADWAIGRFFERARQSAYWDDTVFLVVADHDARVCGACLVPVRHFHIPALFLGAGVEARRDEGITSQADLAPTLLSLAGISSVHPMPGADLTRFRPGRAIMQYGDNHGYLKDDRLLVSEPYRPPRQFGHDPVDASMHEQAVDAALAEEALAHALWPSWAYFNERYRLPPHPHAPGHAGAAADVLRASGAA